MKLNNGNIEIQIKLSIRFKLSRFNLLEIILLLDVVYILISLYFN
ncbi:hypothetical protein [Clostridium sp.]|nr:hypothetical protein [Clostridium sp.]MDU4727653.1 hypothetical protein [Clostridium sp.]